MPNAIRRRQVRRMQQRLAHAAITQFFRDHHLQDVEQDLWYTLHTAIEHGKRQLTTSAAFTHRHVVLLLQALRKVV